MFNIKKNTWLNKEVIALQNENINLNSVINKIKIENENLQLKYTRQIKNIEDKKFYESKIDLLLSICTDTIPILQKDFSLSVDTLLSMLEHSKTSLLGSKQSLSSISENLIKLMHLIEESNSAVMKLSSKIYNTFIARVELDYIFKTYAYR